MGTSILIVEDDERIRTAVRMVLEEEGYQVYETESGEAALDVFTPDPSDVVLVDIMLPGIDGFDVCRVLRDDPPEGVAPRVLMLTARDTVEERIRGLDMGADDYLVKPFAFDELAARVRSLLRRDPGRSGAVLEVGTLSLDTARHHSQRGGRSLDLTAKEFALLHYFMSRPGEVVSQEELLEHVWDEHADPFTNTVRVTVGTLRRKLAIDCEPGLIETVVGRGYRLLGGEPPEGAAR